MKFNIGQISIKCVINTVLVNDILKHCQTLETKQNKCGLILQHAQLICILINLKYNIHVA